MTASYDEAFRKRLIKKIAETRRDHEQTIALGNAVDWADYRYRAGILQGLRLIEEICEQTEKELA